MAKFINLTRVYVQKAKAATATTPAVKAGLKKQPISVRADAIDSVRGSNRLGYPEHRSTLTLRSGMTVELHESKSDVDAALARA
jgi:hypothetical protein